MNLAIVHYHLNRGGVTRVVENQLVALDAVLDPTEPWDVALLYGGRHEGWSEDLPERLQSIQLSLDEIPSLDYDEEIVGSPADGPDGLAEQLASRLAEIGFQPQETVLHVHNHALGKNAGLPASLARLASDGFALLLQIHDFPEDFRPANYRKLRDTLCGQEDSDLVAALYPQAPHIHYAVLNGRDYDILQAAGVAQGRLHRLPNPVPQISHLPPKSQARRRLAERFGVAEHERFVLYPVRCIRRKNLGEALLCSALAPPGTVFGLTLPPLNPAETSRYQRWKQLAAELVLPCRFEVGAPGGLSFAENLAAADLILTTSLAEGFGMVFLESWLASRPLVGRDLPEITGDFAEVGIRFDWLRPRLCVPVEWVGIDAFQRTILEAYGRTLEAYGREEPGDLGGQLEARTDEGLVDFGDLDETLQEQVLRTVSRSDEDRSCVLRCNDGIEDALSIRCNDASEVIGQNVQTIDRHYSREPSGRRLLRLYQQVVASPRDQRPAGLPHGGRILEKFLNFRRFRPIRD